MQYELDRTLQFNDLDDFFNSKEYTKMLINREIYIYETFAEYVNVKIFKKVK